ncbi:DUF6412 domain-containing protein [Rugosimonospora africana]|uniref:Uncharacterized protein n=1 Tax=Rugosimonospora africana TaxID=556532 RepID=A0A8J3QLK7_9ACTN|nr:DUF6412 domain-containing protein [Rugosimonospora africana]GIH11960.1 hypothetical protein Raf01_01320 [Rugosimonospora africana]
MAWLGAAGSPLVSLGLLGLALSWLGLPGLGAPALWAAGLATPHLGAPHLGAPHFRAPHLELLGDVGPAGLLAGTAAAIGVLLVAVLAARLLARRAIPGGVAWRRARILRQEAHRTGIPRYADPDAPGRSRPRAPCAAHAAA